MAYEQWPEIRADQERWVMLGRLLTSRRDELGYGSMGRTRFARDRDVSIRRFAEIEKASPKRVNTWTPQTLKAIARDYEVTYASVVAVLRGEADELAPAAPDAPGAGPPAVTAIVPAAAAGVPGWPPERIAADRPFFDPVNERRVELAAKGITYPGGAEMFGEGTEDAEAWDGRLAPLPVGDRVWAIADLRRRAAARDPGSGVNAADA